MSAAAGDSKQSVAAAAAGTNHSKQSGSGSGGGSAASAAAGGASGASSGGGVQLSSADQKRLDALTCSSTELMSWNRVSSKEIDWMLAQRALKLDEKQLATDYGDKLAPAMIKAISALGGKEYTEVAVPCLMWPGVGTRWKQFIEFVTSRYGTGTGGGSGGSGGGATKLPSTGREVLTEFANSLGRVVSYRSLALTQEQKKTIDSANVYGRFALPFPFLCSFSAHDLFVLFADCDLYVDSIVPTGRLHPRLSLLRRCVK